jgi:Uma2 family endonuclease
VTLLCSASVSALPSRMAPGPFHADQLRSGDRYELSNGHAIYCAPSGGRHAEPNRLGASVVGWDPAVKEAGVDTGYSSGPGMLRAPDVAIGNVPDKPGWVRGAPDLAIEYADVGQDEDDLAIKIAELLEAGTKYLWVVRLTGKRRVELHEPGKPMRTAWPGEMLEAPGVLQNLVRVEALYDKTEAERATFTNLLQRRGYESLEAVLARGREEGREEALRAAVRDMCDLLGIAVDFEREAMLASMRAAELDELRARLKRDRRWD